MLTMQFYREGKYYLSVKNAHYIVYNRTQVVNTLQW